MENEDKTLYFYCVSIETEEVCGTLAYMHYFTDAARFAEEQLSLYAPCFDHVEITISFQGSNIRTYRKG